MGRLAADASAVMRPRTPMWVTIGAIAVAIVAFVVGCSDSDDGDAGQETPATATTGSVNGGADDGTVEAGENGASATPPDAGPERGGRLVLGVEAFSLGGWPLSTGCDGACLLLHRALTDPLFVATEAGEIVPLLAEAAEPNADSTVWTVRIRDGITFHDGTPLDGAAVVYNVEACRAGDPTAAGALSDLAELSSDGQAVTFTYRQPDVLGPRILRAGMCGLVFSPQWLQSLPANPLLTDDERALVTGNPFALVGVGAFTFAEEGVVTAPGSEDGEDVTADDDDGGAAQVDLARNEEYWRGGDGSVTGEGLPFLEEVSLVELADDRARENGVRSGQLDAAWTGRSALLDEYTGVTGFSVWRRGDDRGPTREVVFNVAEGDNAVLAARRDVPAVAMDPGELLVGSLAVDEDCRRALARAVDRGRVTAALDDGALSASGPFRPGVDGHVADPAGRGFDPAAAQASWGVCTADVDEFPLSITVTTSDDDVGMRTAEAIAEMWREQFGGQLTVLVEPVSAVRLAEVAATGEFEVLVRSVPGVADAAEAWHRWSSLTAVPVDPTLPELAANVGRLRDVQVNAALDVVRQDPGAASRADAAETLTRRLTERVAGVWLTWPAAGVVSTDRVNGLGEAFVPGVDPVVATGDEGLLTGAWCRAGDCQG